MAEAVMPAQAGIQSSREVASRRRDGQHGGYWIPAFAGMTRRSNTMTRRAKLGVFDVTRQQELGF